MFWIAGAWGLITLTPLYFLLDSIGRSTPPPVNHPEFFYGFVGLALVWQVAFFLIGSNPARFRPMMIPAMLEKISYVVMMVLLCLRQQVTVVQVLSTVPDAFLAVFFAIAFFKVGKAAA